MKLYGSPFSTCTRKVLTVLHEKGAKYDFHHVDLGKRDQKTPEHLKRQPFGVVPVLEDDGYSLYESRAIMRYLDRRLPGEPLTPQDLHSYGRMEQYISIEHSYFGTPAMVLVHELIMAPMRGQASDHAKVDAAIPKLRFAVSVLDKHLGHNAYLAGERFTLADICYAPYIEYVQTLPLGQRVFSEFVQFSSWWQRVSARPSWKATLALAQR